MLRKIIISLAAAAIAVTAATIAASSKEVEPVTQIPECCC